MILQSQCTPVLPAGGDEGEGEDPAGEAGGGGDGPLVLLPAGCRVQRRRHHGRLCGDPKGAGETPGYHPMCHLWHGF